MSVWALAEMLLQLTAPLPSGSALKEAHPDAVSIPYALGHGWQQVFEPAWLHSQACSFPTHQWDPSRSFNTAMSKQRRQTALIRPMYFKQFTHTVKDAMTSEQKASAFTASPHAQGKEQFYCSDSHKAGITAIN